jgi:hypothetical protein
MTLRLPTHYVTGSGLVLCSDCADDCYPEAIPGYPGASDAAASRYPYHTLPGGLIQASEDTRSCTLCHDAGYGAKVAS